MPVSAGNGPRARFCGLEAEFAVLTCKRRNWAPFGVRAELVTEPASGLRPPVPLVRDRQICNDQHYEKPEDGCCGSWACCSLLGRMEGRAQEAADHRAVLQQRQAQPAAGHVPVHEHDQSVAARGDVDASLLGRRPRALAAQILGLRLVFKIDRQFGTTVWEMRRHWRYCCIVQKAGPMNWPV